MLGSGIFIRRLRWECDFEISNIDEFHVHHSQRPSIIPLLIVNQSPVSLFDKVRVGLSALFHQPSNLFFLHSTRKPKTCDTFDCILVHS